VLGISTQVAYLINGGLIFRDFFDAAKDGATINATDVSKCTEEKPQCGFQLTK
jgi:hypothetical protein